MNIILDQQNKNIFLLRNLSFKSQGDKIFLFALLFTAFSGALRKWFILDKNISNFILFFQLILPFIFVLIFFTRSNSAKIPIILRFYAFALVFMAFNPMNQSIYHGILGFILHMGFWLGIYIYFQNRKLFNLESIYVVVILIGIAEFVLGAIQFNLPKDHILNKYASMEAIKEIALVQGINVRVTGTFSYIAGYSAFFVFYAMVLWAVLRTKRIGLMAFLVLFTVGLVACFMNASRSGTYFLILFAGLALWEYLQDNKLSYVLQRVLLIAGLSFLALIYMNKQSIVTDSILKASQSFQSRRNVTVQSGEEFRRILGPIDEVINYKNSNALAGVGLGASYQGANALWGTSRYVNEFKGYLEEEPERIIFEGGYILLFIRILLFFSLYKMLSMPRMYKIIILGMCFFYLSIVFFTYSSIFFLLGLIVLDRSFLETANIHKT